MLTNSQNVELNRFDIRLLYTAGYFLPFLHNKRRYEYQPGDSYSIHVTERISCTFCEIVIYKDICKTGTIQCGIGKLLLMVLLQRAVDPPF